MIAKLDHLRLTIAGVAIFALSLIGSQQTLAGPPGHAESHNMRLVGFNSLNGRSSYQPTVHHQVDGRYVAYIGHHNESGKDNGTSIVDVTDPSNPTLLAHIPAIGGAQFTQVCTINGMDYLLRNNGNAKHEIWNVTSPEFPSFVSTVVDGLSGTHKNWWECDTGIAYLVADLRPDGWDTSRGLKVFDLNDPENPVFIRDFGLPGSEPGGAGTGDSSGSIHEATSRGDRVYIAYGTGSHGVIQVVDRTKLIDNISGDCAPFSPTAPTADDLLCPQVGRVNMPAFWGGHTAWPITDMDLPEYADFEEGTPRDFLVAVSESTGNGCQEPMHHMAWFLDITDETKPYPVSNFQVPESEGDFCSRGGRFGTHSLNWSYTEPFYRKIVVFSYFNAGARAVDVRDPFHPIEVGYYIPATNANTTTRSDPVNGTKTVIQTNNVEVDDRGYIYLVDRANSGLHIVELTGAAAQILKTE